MARDKGSRRLSRFWWALAFTLGAAAGALSLEFLHAQDTFWTILFLSAITVAIAIFEQFGAPRGGSLRSPSNSSRWGGRSVANHPIPARKQTAGKAPRRRAQLHAITGKKTVEPPSSSSS